MTIETSSGTASAVDRSSLAEHILGVVAEVARELQPAAASRLRPTLDSSLAGDLGIDSLARAELVMRLERAFDVELPDQLVARAERPRDLLALLEEAEPRRSPEASMPSSAAAPEARARPPDDLETLAAIIEWHGTEHPELAHLYFYDDTDTLRELTFGALWDGARRIASQLSERGVEPGQTVAIMLPSGTDYFHAFVGIMLAGAVPVPLYPPVRPSQVEDHLRRQVAILRCAETRAMITNREIGPVARLLRPLVPTLDLIPVADELLASEPGSGRLPPVAASDIAFLQFTSGSTGQPKGVTLTHANLLANLRAMGRALDVGPEVMVSWLPLYHDMGLIGAWMGSLHFSFTLVLMSPLSFLARPSRWLTVMSRHRGTLSAAPNFAYQLCVEKIRDEELEGVDLSSWRLALNGAEAVSPQTIDSFSERFAPWGFRREAMLPVYGLAESSLGLAFPPPGRGPRVDRVQREALTRDARLVPAEKDDAETLTFVSCGPPLPEHEIRIVDDAGRELPEREEGRLQFRGPSTTSGYYRDDDATTRLFDGDWLDSGDRGYASDGELYITGRVKDIVIRAGRNIYPHEVEEMVSEVEGVRKGCVAVFGAREATTGTERLIVLAESRETDAEIVERIRGEIREAVASLVGVAPDDVVVARLGSVLKTSSGKIRRASCRDLYERGLAGGRRGPVWLQLLRMAARSAVALPRRWARRLAVVGYAVWAWIAFLLTTVVWLPIVVTLPGLARRRGAARRACRWLFAVAGVPIRAVGLEHLPLDGQYVVAANHASFADAFILTAVLPPSHAFIAKRELDDHWFTRSILRRVGVHFVERFDAERGAEDARRAAERTRAGESLIFFPEGTFERGTGLLPFRLGTFAVAVSGRRPVVPIGIRGSRTLLRGIDLFPRRAAITVEIAAPIEPAGDDWAATIDLRDRVRPVLVALVGEPDLDGR